MSSQSISGGGGDTAKPLKPDSIRAQIPQLLMSAGGSVKGAMPVVGPRPIAPSPVQVSATQLIAASQNFSNISSNVQLISNPLGGTGDQSQIKALHMRAIQQGLAHHVSGQSTGILQATISQSQPLIPVSAGVHGNTSQSQSLIPNAGVGIHPSGGIIHQTLSGGQNVVLPRGGASQNTATMSLIRAKSLGIQQQSVSSAAAPAANQQQPTYQGAPHVPRGASQVSAINALKSAGASPMLRPNSQAVGQGQQQQPTAQILSNNPTNQAALITGSTSRPGHPVRTHVSGMTSQQVRAGGGATVTNILSQKHQNVQHITTHGEMPQKVSGGSIQISVQPPRNTTEVPGVTRPHVSKLQAKTALHSHQISHQQQNNTANSNVPKVLMSPQGVTKIDAGVGRLNLPVGIQPMHRGARPHLPVMHQAGGLTISHPQHKQKIIVSQANTPSQTLSSGTIITARTGTTMNHGGIRQQKVVVSQLSGGPTHHAPVPKVVGSNLPVTVQQQHHIAHAQQPRANAQEGAGGVVVTSTHANITTIPVAKVPPQRHVVHNNLLTGVTQATDIPVPSNHAHHSIRQPNNLTATQTTTTLSAIQTAAPPSHGAHHSSVHHHVTQQGASHAASHAAMLLQPRTVVTSGMGPNETVTKTLLQNTQSDRQSMSRIADLPFQGNSALNFNIAQALAAVSAATGQQTAVNRAPIVTGQPVPAQRLVAPGAAMMVSLQDGRTVTAHDPTSGGVAGGGHANSAVAPVLIGGGGVTSVSGGAGGVKHEIMTTMASSQLQNVMGGGAAGSAVAAGSVMAAAGHVPGHLLANQHAAMGQGVIQPQQPGPGQNSNVPASPRPSILRKRTHEGVSAAKRQIFNNSTLPPGVNQVAQAPPPHMTQVPPPHVLQAPPQSAPANQSEPVAMSPKAALLDPSRENSQSSTDTASSNESTPGKAVKVNHGEVKVNNCEVKVKTEVPETVLENGDIAASTVPNNNNEASPRKKPRKQLLHANTDEMKAEKRDTDEERIEKFSRAVSLKREQDMLEEEAEKQSQEELTEFVDEDGVRWTREKKRPPIALLSHYQCSWKPKNNHFLRYTDVKPKDERRPTVNELANQKHVHQKCSGWKMYHLTAQVEDLVELENEVLKKMTGVREQVAPKHSTKASLDDDQLSMVHELSQGNIQRNKLFMDQMNEAKTAMIKILDHKKRILNIVNKHHSKRPVKKKERS